MLKPTSVLFYLFLCFPILYYVYSCIAYLFTPSFFDHIEPSMVMLSALIKKGLPVYTEINDVNRITLVYGPVSFLFNALFQELISDPILAGKLCGVMVALISLSSFFGVLFYKYSIKSVLISASYCSLILISFGNISFWNRPESVLLLGCALACISLIVKNKSLSILLLSFGTSVVINSRLTGILYLLPVFTFIFFSDGRKYLKYSILLSVLLIILPFILFNSFDVTNYMIWLQKISNHNFSPYQFIRSLIYSALIVSPIIPIILIRFYKKEKDFKTIAISLALLIGFVFASLIASKEGAGSHHLLPFVLFVSLLLAMHIEEVKQAWNNIAKSRKVIVILFGCLWLSILTYQCFIGTQKRYIDFLFSDNGGKVKEELLKLKREYSGYSIFMGYSGDDYEQYKLTFFRPILIPNAKDYFIDPPAMMDMVESGVHLPSSTVSRLSLSYYEVCIIPKGADPFSIHSRYLSRKEIFSQNFRNSFSQHYSKIEDAKYFSIYKQNSLK